MREGWARSGCGAHGGRTALHCLGPSRAITSILASPGAFLVRKAQCTYRCVVLPDVTPWVTIPTFASRSQCTYRCVVLPDQPTCDILTRLLGVSQCTYRCVVLPDSPPLRPVGRPAGSQCTYRCVVLPDAPDGAFAFLRSESQCTYRCVVLPDPCLREWRYDATSRARSATGPGSTPPDRPAPGSD